MKCVLPALLVLCVIHGSVAQWVQKIEGISLSSLLESKEPLPRRSAFNWATVNNEFNFRPLSMRTVYRYHTNYAETAPVDLANLVQNGFPTETEDIRYNALIVDGIGIQSIGADPEDQVVVWLEPYGIGSCNAAPSVLDPTNVCERNDLPNDATTTIQTKCRLSRINVLSSTDRLAFWLPVRRLSVQLNHASWICIKTRDPNDFASQAFSNIWTGLLYQVAPRCDASNSADAIKSVDFVDNLDAAIGAVDQFPHACQDQANLNRIVDAADPNGPRDLALQVLLGESPATGDLGVEWDYIERRHRTVCCGWRSNGLLDEAGNTLAKRWGVCINPLTEACCSSATDNRKLNGAADVNFNKGGAGKPYNPFYEKCCFGGTQDFTTSLQTETRTAGIPVITSFLDDWCPCVNNRVGDFCPAAQQCCTFSKYSELVPTDATQVFGRCYDPRERQCCNTGETFNPGAAQCCTITGVQDLNVPCPCGSNADCHATNQTCCKQMWPAPIEAESCTIYSNYPSGTGPYESQRCLGQCIDTRYQICCNGVACIDEYERCCNNTCCNRFTETCAMGQQNGFLSSSNNFRIPYEQCTEIEALTAYRAVVAFFLPLCLLLATFIGLAASLFFAKRLNSLNPLSAYEKGMLALSLISIAFAWPLYFSPLYKYAVVMIWVAFFTIVAALAGIKRLVVAAIFLQAFVLMYIFDPVSGNELLTFGYTRADRATNRDFGGGTYQGLFMSLKWLWGLENSALPDSRSGGRRCTWFYDGWFTRDPLVEDQTRWDNPNKFTYGFCARDWIGALMIFEGFNACIFILLFFTTLVTYVKNVLIKKVIAQNPLHY